MSDTPRTNALERAHLTPGGDPGAEHIALQWHALAVQLERDLIQQHREYLESVAYVEQLEGALKALVDMCVTHIGVDYSDHVHACYERGKAALANNPTVAALDAGLMPLRSGEPSFHQATVGGSRPSGYHQSDASLEIGKGK